MRPHRRLESLTAAADPKLQVLWPIVILDAVLVVHVFVEEMAPQQLFHDEEVLEDVPVGGLCLGMREHAPQHVTGPMFHGSAAPVAVARASLRRALETRLCPPGLERAARARSRAGPCADRLGTPRGSTVLGSGLALGSAACWAASTAIARRLGGADPLVTTALTSGIGAAVVGPVALPSRDWSRLAHASAPVIAATPRCGRIKRELDRNTSANTTLSNCGESFSGLVVTTCRGRR
jgi:hypothetical protein